MIDMSAWGWPQWGVASWLFIGGLLAAHLHGKPRTGNYSFPMALMVRILWAAMFVAGGFFS